MIMLIPGIPQSSGPQPHRTRKHEIQDVQPSEPNEVLPVRRLDGEVTRTGDIAFTAGAHCEIWIGEWVKGGRMEGGVEKVRLRPILSTPLTWSFVGGLENTSSTSVARESAYG